MIGTLICLLSALVFLLPQAAAFEALGYTSPGDWQHLYQTLTYVFCHINLSHFAFNMLMLVPSAWYLEQEVGWKPTAWLCGISAMASALLWDYAFSKSAFFILYAGQPRMLIGASGVASATVCAALLVLAQRQRHLAGPAYLMLLAIFGSNLSDALLAQANMLPVAYWGHIGGYLVGLFMAPSLCQPKPVLLPKRRR
jgi:membrane associated rhomboid family serine protease